MKKSYIKKIIVGKKLCKHTQKLKCSLQIIRMFYTYSTVIYNVFYCDLNFFKIIRIDNMKTSATMNKRTEILP